jgi:hypothetical protein
MVVETIALSLLAGSEAAHFFSAFCPSIFTIRKLAIPEGGEADIRRGMYLGLAMGIGLGILVSVIAKSWLPLIFTAIIAGVIFFIYEYHLRE